MLEEAPNGARADQRSWSRKEVETFLKAAKITILKSLTKSAQSTRKLAARLTSKGHKVSHETVRKHMRQSLKVLPFKPQLQPLLTAVQKAKWVKFCRERKSWGIDKWRKVLFSDESLFELFHPPNRQNDQIWARDKEEVPPPSQSSIRLKSRSGAL